MNLEEFLESDKSIYILDGVAGSGKTSQTVKYLQEHDIEYLHTTSTNALKRACEKRFNHSVYTTCAALFDSKNGFYDAFRSNDAQVIIIDEILQTSPRVFDWIAQNRYGKKIIICTDSKQMLSPGVDGRACLECLQSLKKAHFSAVSELVESFRPVDAETARMYNILYQADMDKEAALPDFPRISYEAMQYTGRSYYMTHANLYERMMYERFRIDRDYTDVIPKGYAPEKVSENYPIMSQDEAIRIGSRAYYQARRVGSVYRFQGREVEAGERIFYLLGASDKVSGRELYTMVTRARSIKDIVLVTMPEVEKAAPVSFAGLPIVQGAPLFVKSPIPFEKVDAALAIANEKSAKYYTRVICDGKEIKAPKTSKRTLYSVLKKDPRLAVSNPATLYQAIDCDFYPVSSVDRNDAGRPDEYQYALDLHAAFPHCWANGHMPDGATYRPDASGDIGIYLTTSQKYGQKGMLITSDYKDYMEANGAEIPAKFCGSYKVYEDEHIGKELLKMAYTSVETKKRLHELHWGFARKKYYDPVYKGGKIVAYCVQDFARYELLLTAIQSELALQLAKLRLALFDDPGAGATRTDCIYFDYSGDIQALGGDLQELIKGYDFRIVKNGDPGVTSEKTCLYKTYPDLMTNKQRHAAAEKARRAAKKVSNE